MNSRVSERSPVSGIVVDAWRTPVTALVCLAAIAISVLGFSSIGFEPFVADERAFGHEPWRLVTSHFLHANGFHLFFDLYWTWTLGRLLEPRLGRLRFAAINLALALGVTLGCYAFDREGIGLSGIVYGLWALILVGGWRFEALRGLVQRKVHVAFVLWFFLCVVTTRLGVMNVSNLGHGLGALLGATFAWTLDTTLRFRRDRLIADLALYLVLFGCATFGRVWVNFGAGAADDERVGWLAWTRGDFEHARDAYERATRIAPEAARSWQGLGAVEQRLGHEKASVDALYRAFELGGLKKKISQVNLTQVLARQSIAAFDARREDQALEYAVRAVRVSPDAGPMWGNVQHFASDVGDKDWIERSQHELERLEFFFVPSIPVAK